MRTWIAGLLALGMLVGWVTTAMAAPHKAASAAPLVYLCPTCGIGAARPVACPQCGKAMGRVAAYACMKDQISSDAPGPCPNCHTPMASLAALYRHCPTCGFYYPRSKHACPVCAKRHKRRHH
jgi:hypothetical protein